MDMQYGTKQEREKANAPQILIRLPWVAGGDSAVRIGGKD